MNSVTSKLTVLRRSLVLAAAVVATGAAATTFAATPDAPSVAVRYGDLNLDTPAGVNALYHRIAQAAAQVCPDLSSRDLTMVAAVQQCRTETIARAVHATQNQQLAALYLHRAPQG